MDKVKEGQEGNSEHKEFRVSLVREEKKQQTVCISKCWN